jgi:hypothetical protein
MNDPLRVARPALAVALAGIVAVAGCDSGSTDPGDPEAGFSPRGQGCTVQFWSAEANLELWPEGYPTSRRAGEHFPERTYLDVLRSNGDGLEALGRQAVAGILNAAHPGVEYGMAPEMVVGAFNRAATDGVYDGLRDALETLNHRRCPL